LVVDAITTALTPWAGAPAMPVTSGNSDAKPWMSLVIGELPYAKTAGVIASKACDGSGSTTSPPENARP
jgi:hypothetical protein